MKLLAKQELIVQLREKNNYNNQRMIEAIDCAKHCFLTTIESPEYLLQLVFHYHKNSQVLTPKRWWGGGRLYPMIRVIEFMKSKQWRFEDLAKKQLESLQTQEYQREFFEICSHIYEKFSYDQFGHLVLRPLNFAEFIDCPSSPYRIIDGMHRALVLAYKSYENRAFFKPVPAFLIH